MLLITSMDNTFENFKKVKGTEESFDHFSLLASGTSDWQLLLNYGGVGNGKTHLCEATAIKLLERGIYCRVQTMSRIMTDLKACISPDPMVMPMQIMMQRYSQMPYLIIDDVGMGSSGSEWEWRQLEEIIVYRYRDKRFTIMTTNLDTTDLPERVVSRFSDREKGRVVLNEGKDYRTLK